MIPPDLRSLIASVRARRSDYPRSAYNMGWQTALDELEALLSSRLEAGEAPTNSKGENNVINERVHAPGSDVSVPPRIAARDQAAVERTDQHGALQGCGARDHQQPPTAPAGEGVRPHAARHGEPFVSESAGLSGTVIDGDRTGLAVRWDDDGSIGRVVPSELIGWRIHNQPPAGEAPAPAEDYKALYHDLLLQVVRKHPSETRHETAKRYIKQAEEPQNNPPKQATRATSEKGLPDWLRRRPR